ncbi:hypothetical protein K439DRAFT_1326217, partial [Ramaria rubella]
CKRQISRYTCPTCNVPYCSLTCFRSDFHSECSETFYRKEIEMDIKTTPAKSSEERKKMMELLRKFEEESAQGPDILAEDNNDLAEKLETMNLDDAQPEEIWSLLSPDQRDSFLRVMRDPSSDLARQLLSSAELQHGRRKPWWESPRLDTEEITEEYEEFGPPPPMISIPQNLISNEAITRLNQPLVYNILALCLFYSYVTRRLSISSLSTLTLTDPDHAEARNLLFGSATFLVDRKSTLLLESVDDLVTYAWSRLEALSDPPSNQSFCLLLEDATKLFRPQPVLVMTKGDPHSHPSRLALLALSDIVLLFTTGTEKFRHVVFKLNFYAAYLHAQNTDILKLVAEEARITNSNMASQSKA